MKELREEGSCKISEKTARETFFAKFKKTEDPTLIKTFCRVLRLLRKLQDLFKTIHRETAITEAIQKCLLIQKLEYLIISGNMGKKEKNEKIHSKDKKMDDKNSKLTNLKFMYEFLTKHREYIFEYAVLQLKLIEKDAENLKELDSSRLLFILRKVKDCKEKIKEFVSCRHAASEAKMKTWKTPQMTQMPCFYWPSGMSSS